MAKSDGLSVVLTGVSSGIGSATARLLTERGARVFGSVRSAADAARVAAALGPPFTPLFFDVRDEAALGRAAEDVRGALGGRTLSGLVNNAGIALPGPALAQPLSEMRDVLETNLLGAILATRAFAPLLGADPALSGPPGRVVMISSIAGKLGQPFLSAYTASKHGLEGFSESLRRELQLFGVDVVVIGASPVRTPIWAKAKPFVGRYAATPFGDAFDEGLRGLTTIGETEGLDPARMAETVWTALTAAHPRPRYAPSAHPAIDQGLGRVLPRRWLDRLFGVALGLRPGR